MGDDGDDLFVVGLIYNPETGKRAIVNEFLGYFAANDVSSTNNAIGDISIAHAELGAAGASVGAALWLADDDPGHGITEFLDAVLAEFDEAADAGESEAGAFNLDEAFNLIDNFSWGSFFNVLFDVAVDLINLIWEDEIFSSDSSRIEFVTPPITAAGGAFPPDSTATLPTVHVGEFRASYELDFEWRHTA